NKKTLTNIKTPPSASKKLVRRRLLAEASSSVPNIKAGRELRPIKRKSEDESPESSVSPKKRLRSNTAVSSVASIEESSTPRILRRNSSPRRSSSPIMAKPKPVRSNPSKTSGSKVLNQFVGNSKDAEEPNVLNSASRFPQGDSNLNKSCKDAKSETKAPGLKKGIEITNNNYSSAHQVFSKAFSYNKIGSLPYEGAVKE